MSIPNVTEIANTYFFEWKDENLTISVSRLREHSDGRITGEVNIRTTAPGIAPHLHQAQFNFVSTRSRQELARAMYERYNLVNWVPILEQLCVITLKRLRQGEPVHFLSTETDAAPPGYLISPILPLAQPTTIFGLPGTGKSYLALLLALTAAIPWEDNPMGFEVPAGANPVLYLDYETSKDETHWRLKKLARGTGLGPTIISYRRCSKPLSEDMEGIQRAVFEASAKLIIIDSLGGACGGDLYVPEPALRFFSALRKLNTTSLIVAHTSKESAKEKSILGTVYFTAYSRQIFETRLVQEPEETEVSIGLFHRKSNSDKLLRPIGLHIFFDEEQTRIEKQDVRSIADFLEHLSLSERAMEYLREGPAPLAEISEALGKSKETMRVILKRLEDKKQITRLPGTKEKIWGISLLKT